MPNTNDNSSESIELQNLEGAGEVKDSSPFAENKEEDYSFETEEKPKELTTLQKRFALSKSLKENPIMDNVPFKSVLRNVTSKHIESKNVDLIELEFQSLENSQTIKETIIFDDSNEFLNDFSLKRLEAHLEKFSIDITAYDFAELSDIRDVLINKVDSIVTLIQTTRKEYKNYSIVSVEKKK